MVHVNDFMFQWITRKKAKKLQRDDPGMILSFLDMKNNVKLCMKSHDILVSFVIIYTLVTLPLG